MLWLIPIVRPLPAQGDTGGSPTDWIALGVVVAVLALVVAVLVVVENRVAKTAGPAFPPARKKRHLHTAT